VFTRDAHCVAFLETLGSVTREYGWEVHAWALMPNHYHLLVRSVEGNLSDCMKMLAGRYTRWLNRAEGWDGPTFRGRFRSQLIVEDLYLQHLVAYIHLNPVRARLVRRADQDCWTSHRAHLGLDDAPSWMARWMVQQQFGSPEQLQDYVRGVHSGRERWPDELDLETGWISQPAAAKRAFPRAGEEADAASELLDTEDLLRRVVAITGVKKAQLMRPTRGPAANPARRFAVWMLSRHSALTHKQIGAALDMPSRQVESLLYRMRKRKPSAPLPVWQAAWDEAYAPRPAADNHGTRSGHEKE
jgi:REP element-mobilizing transposase RayT